MIGEADFSLLGGPEREAWIELLELATAFPDCWAVVGAQMVVLHAAVHDVLRPSRTRDIDVLVDLRTSSPEPISQHLIQRGFSLLMATLEGVAHRFRRGDLFVDVLATDHAGDRAKLTTVPPSRTLEVPGGRSAMNHIDNALIHVGGHTGNIPVPDWIGALVVKSQAAIHFKSERQKHLVDIALLMGLPVDAAAFVDKITRGERRHIMGAIALIDEDVWRALGTATDPLIAKAAIRLFG